MSNNNQHITHNSNFTYYLNLICRFLCVSHLPRIFFFCLQYTEIVPRIVWPEKYVFVELSSVTLNFSCFVVSDPSDRDCNELAGDDDAMDGAAAVDVAKDAVDWSIETELLSAMEFSSEFSLILKTCEKWSKFVYILKSNGKHSFQVFCYQLNCYLCWMYKRLNDFSLFCALILYFLLRIFQEHEKILCTKDTLIGRYTPNFGDRKWLCNWWKFYFGENFIVCDFSVFLFCLFNLIYVDIFVSSLMW